MSEQKTSGCLLGVLDTDKKFQKVYEQLVAESAEISNVRYVQTGEELFEAISSDNTIGLVCIDMASCDSSETDYLIKFRANFPHVAVIGVAKPGRIAELISLKKQLPNLDFIAKPMSCSRLKPLVKDVMENLPSADKGEPSITPDSTDDPEDITDFDEEEFLHRKMGDLQRYTI